MTVIERSLVACVECRVLWYKDHEPARCTFPSHNHQQLKVHWHRSVVVLPDGTAVTGVSYDVSDPYARDRPPDYGLYLDHRWHPPWTHEHLEWPDFGLPDDVTLVVSSLRSVLNRARGGQRVEIGCLGGHGRTGTALACLAILCGLPPGAALAWVRANYCADAVETADQEAFIAGLDVGTSAT